MSSRQIPKVESYGRTLSDLTSDFNLINESITDYSSLSEIEEALGKLFTLLSEINQSIEKQSLAELEESHSYLEMLAKQQARLQGALTRLTRRGVTLPAYYNLGQVMALSPASGQHDTDITGWLRSLPKKQPELKLAAIVYEQQMLDEDADSQWYQIDEIMNDAGDLVWLIQNTIMELESKQHQLEESGYMEEDPDVVAEMHYAQDEDEEW